MAMASGGEKSALAASNCSRSVIILFTLLAIASYLFVSGASPTQSTTGARPRLTFTKNGTFQIAIFGDLHFGENAWEDWGPRQDLNTLEVMNKVLDAESQQLVVLNGDLITGENAFLENSTSYIDQLVKPMVERNLPWASTYGNHDSQFNLSREDILARERQYHNSLTKQMVFDSSAGVSNYYLPVYPHEGADTPTLLLWFFDSRGGFRFQEKTPSGIEVGQPNWVDQTVVDWFKTTNARLVEQHKKTIPSLAFVHIPTEASRALQMAVGVHPHRQPGINDDLDLAQQAQGWCPDGRFSKQSCSYGGQDIPFMEALVTTRGLMTLFSGHDHGDTWCYRWDRKVPGMTVKGNGISGLKQCNLQNHSNARCRSMLWTVCRHTLEGHSGYGGYGRWTRGARQVLVTEAMLQDLAVDTWIRLEFGDVVGSVQLNGTYNDDWYPATPNTRSKDRRPIEILAGADKLGGR